MKIQITSLPFTVLKLGPFNTVYGGKGENTTNILVYLQIQ